MQKDDDRAEDYVLGLTNIRPHSRNAKVRHDATVKSLLLSKFTEWLQKNDFVWVKRQFNDIEKIEWADWEDTYSNFQLMGIWTDLEQEKPDLSLEKFAKLNRYE